MLSPLRHLLDHSVLVFSTSGRVFNYKGIPVPDPTETLSGGDTLGLCFPIPLRDSKIHRNSDNKLKAQR